MLPLLALILLLFTCSACEDIFYEPAPQTNESGTFDGLFKDDPPEVTGEILADLRVHYIDVGQGDSTLIQLPNGQTMLIDGGKQSDSQKLLDYLKGMEIKSIDFLIATHPHEDHIGGLPAVIKELDIRSIYMPRVEHTTRAFENLLLSIMDQGLSINTAKSGVNIVTLPDLQIDIVAPVGSAYNDMNNHSAVIKLTYKNKAFLFTADAEGESEKQITANIKSEVLKVGHHGGNTSTTEDFLRKVAPEIAIISCGKDNSYGHPHKELLDRLATAGAKVYRTDELGTIIITYDDGDWITIETENAIR